MEVLKGSFEQVEDENAADEEGDEEGNDGEEAASSSSSSSSSKEKDPVDRLDDTMTLWRPIRVNGNLNRRIFDNVRLLREKLASVQRQTALSTMAQIKGILHCKTRGIAGIAVVQWWQRFSLKDPTLSRAI